MRSTLSLIRREFVAYFVTPVGYLVLAAFFAATGALFAFAQELLTARGPLGVEYPLQAIAGTLGFWLVMWVVPPLLTMRSFAEERASGTLEMLLTAPLRDGQVVLGKFLAAYLFYLLLLAGLLGYVPVLNATTWSADAANASAFGGGLALFAIGAALLMFARTLGGRNFGAALFLLGPLVIAGAMGWRWNQGERPFVPVAFAIDPRPAAATFLGLALVGAMFLSIGLWISSLVRSQVVAALLTLGALLPFIAGGVLLSTGLIAPPTDAGLWSYRWLQFFTVPLHFRDDFCRGVVDTRHLVLYSSVALAGLFLSVRSLESRRWQ